MTNPSNDGPGLEELAGGPFDIDFFFDPGCPFAWQTSVWIRRVQELADVSVAWRFISLLFLNENNDQPPELVAAHEKGLGYHRICAAARASFGNDAVGALYRGWGERFWYIEMPPDATFGERIATAVASTDPADVVATAGLPADLLEAADDASWDTVIRAETDEALRRTGDDVGTPILTYDPPNGNSLFGPVISTIPPDDRAVEIYEAVRTLADYPTFSELKRSARADLALPLLGGEV